MGVLDTFKRKTSTQLKRRMVLTSQDDCQVTWDPMITSEVDYNTNEPPIFFLKNVSEKEILNVHLKADSVAKRDEWIDALTKIIESKKKKKKKKEDDKKEDDKKENDKKENGSTGDDLDNFETALSRVETHVEDKEEEKKSDDEIQKLVYQAESPDEGALCEGASDAGFQFVNRTYSNRSTLHPPLNFPHTKTTGTTESLTIRLPDGSSRTYKLRAINGFSSARKRMSVVVEMPDGSFVLLCKGADNVMLDRASGKVMDQVEINNWKSIAESMEVKGETDSWFYLRARAIADGKPDPMPSISELLPGKT